MNKESTEDFLTVITELAYPSGIFGMGSGEITIEQEINNNAFKFKLHMHRTTVTFVAYKKDDEYFLHHYNSKGFPLTINEFEEYLSFLACVGEIEITKKADNGKKPK